MPSLFDDDVLRDTVRRIDTLHAGTPRHWGKMTSAQMLEHLTRALEMAAGIVPHKQVLVGKVISWVARKKFIGEQPFGKNSPTSPSLVVSDEPEFAAAKARLIEVMRTFAAGGAAGCEGHVHAFFGRMSGEEWGITQWKHLDHHLRQFGA